MMNDSKIYLFDYPHTSLNSCQIRTVLTKTFTLRHRKSKVVLKNSNTHMHLSYIAPGVIRFCLRTSLTRFSHFLVFVSYSLDSYTICKEEKSYIH